MNEQEKVQPLSIKLKVSPAEKAELQAAADRASLPLATYIRVTVLREARDEAMSARIIPPR